MVLQGGLQSNSGKSQKNTFLCWENGRYVEKELADKNLFDEKDEESEENNRKNKLLKIKSGLF